MKDPLKNYVDTQCSGTSTESFVKKKRALLASILDDPGFGGELAFHNALSKEIRLALLKFLEKNPSCTCALASIFGKGAGTIHHHLKILERAGLIFGKKSGYFTIYYTKKEFKERFID
ncbi:MAG: winged helix-turn-helix domain-containing protein [Promethearchaeota archaeon]